MMLGYPSIQVVPAEQLRPVIAAYVQLLGEFSDEAVEAACIALSKREGAFVPARGDVYAACERVQRAMAANLPRERLGAIATGKDAGRSLAFVTSKPAANF